MSITPDDLLILSKKSASKYKNTSHNDDLVSEGVLAGLEELRKDPDATEQKLYQQINFAQWKHLNVDRLAVTVPEHLVRIAKGMGSEGVEKNYTKETIEWAKLICNSSQFNTDFHEQEDTSEQEDEVHISQAVDAIWSCAASCLNKDDFAVFCLKWDAGMDGKSIGDMVGVSKQAMNKRLNQIEEKVKRSLSHKNGLCNKT